MSSLMELLLLLVCGYFPALCNESSRFIFNRSDSVMTTFIKTVSDVYHLEKDQYIDGNILYSDRYALKTSNGKVTQTIVGKALSKGYRDGVGEAARFKHIMGIYQTNETKDVLLDLENNCLRIVDRTTQQSQTFTGICTQHGYVDGSPSQALFYNPWSMIPDRKNQDKLLVTDRYNRAVRHVDIKTGIVSTFYKDRALEQPYGITQDVPSGNLYMTSLSAVFQLSYLKKELTLIAGTPTWPGHRDGDFSVSRFSQPAQLLLIDNGRTLLVADQRNNRLRVLDMESNMTYSLCTGTAGNTDGDMDSCSLHVPYSLLVSGDSLYIGEYPRIRIISAQASLTTPPTTATTPTTTTSTTSTSISTTSLPTKPCTNGNITRQLLPGEKTVNVEIVPGHSLQLPSGEYLHKIVSEPDNCTIHISIIEEKDAGFQCPGTVVALSHPISGLGQFSMRCEGRRQSIHLPSGRYPYAVETKYQTCNATLVVQDSRMRKVLEFTADYNVECDILSNKLAVDVILRSANQRGYADVERVCRSDCSRSNKEPKISCGDKNKLNIRWTTDVTFTADVMKVPLLLQRELEERILKQGLMLSITVITRKPLVVYPVRADHGRYARLSLSSRCSGNETYSEEDMSCI